MPGTRRSLLAAGVLSGVAAATGACSQPRAKAGSGPDRVTYVTGLGAYGREGFVWVAAARGFFREANLDVTVVPGAAGDVNLSLVGNGRAQFAEIDYTGGVMRAGLGTFKDFRMVASLNTTTLIAIMSLPGRGITAPTDLAGKTILEASGSVIGRLFPAYAKLARIDAATVTWADGAATNLPQLLANKTAPAVGVFVPGAPSVAAAAQVPLSSVVVLPYSQFLQDLPGNVVVTSAHLAQSNPNLVRRFVTALIRGLVYMVDNPDESAQLLHQAVPATAVATAAAEMRLLQPYGPARTLRPAGRSIRREWLAGWRCWSRWD